MKLWILLPMNGLQDGDNPWEPWYDKCFGMIIRAETEEVARQLANDSGQDENRGEFMRKRIARTKAPWLDANYSTCSELTAEGQAEVIMKNVQNA